MPIYSIVKDSRRGERLVGVAGNSDQGFGGGAEKEVVGDLLVIEGNGGYGLGEGEDNMKILGLCVRAHKSTNVVPPP